LSKFCTSAVLLLLIGSCAIGQDRYYLGALGGLAILSGDAGSSLSSTATRSSIYNPANGPALNVFAGTLLSDYLSLQANYIRNANQVAGFSNTATANGFTGLRQSTNTSQQAFTGDVLLYFRNRRSEFRPYLSVGAGFVHLSSHRTMESIVGNPEIQPADDTSTNPALRVAVGIDVRIRHGWAFRYSFSETLTHNPLSERLSPPGQHALKNFQNLFGFLIRL
jgi:Outer membrane protein beta-barrel domain